MIDENWKRWIKVSVFKFFDAGKGSTFLFKEGENQSVLQGKTQWTELRVTGPSIRNPSKNYYELTTEINALCCSTPTGNIYSLDSLVGQYQTLFAEIIPVYKLGNGESDDQSLLGCLERQDDLLTTDWGSDSANVQIARTAIEGTYKLKLET